MMNFVLMLKFLNIIKQNDINIWYHIMISYYNIIIWHRKWYHKMISYSIIIRWYHNIVLCSRNQAWEAGNFQIGGFSPYEGIFTWNFQNRGFPEEPGVGNLHNIPPVALISKNPYRQSLIGEKEQTFFSEKPSNM